MQESLAGGEDAEQSAQVDYDVRIRDPREALDDFERRLASYVGAKRAHALLLLARAREMPDLPALFQAAGGKVDVRRELASLDLRANFEGTRIRSLDPGDLAALLGRCEGDELLIVNGRTVDGRSVDPVALLRQAWGDPRAGRITLRFRRGDEEHELDVAHPRVLRYTVDPSSWYPLPMTVRPTAQPLSTDRAP
jgi:hypothetical protein